MVDGLTTPVCVPPGGSASMIGRNRVDRTESSNHGKGAPQPANSHPGNLPLNLRNRISIGCHPAFTTAGREYDQRHRWEAQAESADAQILAPKSVFAERSRRRRQPSTKERGRAPEPAQPRTTAERPSAIPIVW